MDLNITKEWKINVYYFEEIKNIILDSIVKARLNKAIFCIVKDKILYNKFV